MALCLRDRRCTAWRRWRLSGHGGVQSGCLVLSVVSCDVLAQRLGALLTDADRANEWLMGGGGHRSPPRPHRSRQGGLDPSLPTLLTAGRRRPQQPAPPPGPRFEEAGHVRMSPERRSVPPPAPGRGPRRSRPPVAAATEGSGCRSRGAAAVRTFRDRRGHANPSLPGPGPARGVVMPWQVKVEFAIHLSAEQADRQTKLERAPVVDRDRRAGRVAARLRDPARCERRSQGPLVPVMAAARHGRRALPVPNTPAPQLSPSPYAAAISCGVAQRL